MNEERQLAYRIRQALNHGADSLSPATAERLHLARQNALARHQIAIGGLSLAGIGQFASDTVLHHGRMALAITVVLIGAMGASYWNSYQQADDNEEIDSALLADDLPINAYLDQGFHAWLERSAPQQQQ